MAVDYTWEEIDQMADILEAEIAGGRFDPPAARNLALRVAELCPDIRASMNLIAVRMMEHVESTK